MDRKVRQRILRSLVGAVLQSDLTDKELAELGRELNSLSFAAEFGSLLRRVLPSLTASQDLKGDREDYRLQEAMSQINRRRLSKHGVEELFWRASDGRFVSKIDKKQTVREAVQDFLDRASLAEVDSFLKSLSTSSSDPFLKGITEKNK